MPCGIFKQINVLIFNQFRSTLATLLYFTYAPIKGKCKVQPGTGHERPEGEYRYSSILSLTSALDGGGWSMPRPGRFTPGKEPVLIVQEVGWAPGQVWTRAGNLNPNGIRSPGRPARSEFMPIYCL